MHTKVQNPVRRQAPGSSGASFGARRPERTENKNENAGNDFLERQKKKQLKVISVLMFVLGGLILLSMVSYTPADEANTEITFSELGDLFTGGGEIRAKAETTQNWLGILGAVISDFFYNSTIGYAALLVPMLIIWWGKQLFHRSRIPEIVIKKTFTYLLIGILFSAAAGSLGNISWFDDMAKEWSGAMGQFLSGICAELLGTAGAFILCITAFGTAFFLGTDIKYEKLWEKAKPISKKTAAFILPYIRQAKNRIFNRKDIAEAKKENSEKTVNSDDIAGRSQSEPEAVTNQSNDTARIMTRSFNVKINNPAFKIKNQPSGMPKEDAYVSFEEKYKDEHTDSEEIRYHDAPLERVNTNDGENQDGNNIESDGHNGDSFSDKEIEKEVKDEDTLIENAEKTENESNQEYQIETIENSNQDIHADASDEESLNNDKSDTLYKDKSDNEDISSGEFLEDEKLPDGFEKAPVNEEEENYNISDAQDDDEDYTFYNENELESEEIENEDESTDETLRPLNVTVRKAEQKQSEPVFPLSTDIHEEEIDFEKVPLDILVEQAEGFEVDEEELNNNARILQEKLETFKIFIENLTVTPGPVVTQYEFVPAPGIKISKIENLADDIAMAMKARGIRIIAPVPGKGTVGIEIPNHRPSLVRFSSIVSSSQFHENKHRLPLALGKTITGDVYCSDLAKMPHLLIAGSTGSGKSVGINTIICSLLFKMHPSKLKFVIIDPKKVEMTYYGKLRNHYLAVSPDIDDSIITNPEDAVIILNSLCAEMDKRYDILAKAGQRNIKDYNEKVREGKYQNDPDIIHREMPYIVVVVDELADLMLTAGKEVETPITRLAQLARAVGIHLVVATQRPSVDVITGIIKANFPARISYLVASKIDSRTILDLMGAEKLLGNGDMLFLAGGSPKPLRIQNAFVSTDEVESICNYIGSQEGYSDAYILPSLTDGQSGSGSIGKEDRDPLFEEAAKLVVQQQQGSVSLIQRRLKVGYARAGRIVDELEDAGIVGPFDGSKARQVMLTDEDELEDIL